MKKLVAAVAVLAAAVSSASAAGNAQPFCQNCGPQFGVGSLLIKHPMPAFQAAPWYMYYPYDAHFQTPAPLGGPYYAPPPGGQLVNPYFPGHGYNPAAYPVPR